MKGTVLFDFDYTLLDTVRLKHAMADTGENCGVPAGLFWEPYESAHGGARNRDFDLKRHLDALAEKFACDRACLQQRVGAVLDGMSGFLFSGAGGILARLHSDGYGLVLLTHGNLEWQKMRVEKSGLGKLFAQIFYTTEEKENALHQLEHLSKPLIVVNDNGLEIDAMQAILPDAKCIAMRGPKPLPRDPSVPVCVTLEDAYKLIVKV